MSAARSSDENASRIDISNNTPMIIHTQKRPYTEGSVGFGINRPLGMKNRVARDYGFK